MLAPIVLALTGAVPGAPGLDARVAGVDRARLEADLVALQSVPGATRATGTPGAQAARAHVTAALEAQGLEVRAGAFVTHDPFRARPVVGVNLWTRLGPDSGPAVVLVAHLDTKGAKTPEEAAARGWRPDRDPAPGADDNASGAAALLAVARALKGAVARRPVVLAWTDAEELTETSSDGFMRGYGAAPLADALDLPPGSTALAVDMLLRARPEGRWLRLYTDGRAASTDWAWALPLAAAVYAPSLLLDVRVAPGFVWSDHAAFWAAGRGGALLIEDDFHHARYHRPTDRWAPDDPFYDPGQLTAATRALVGAVGLLAGVGGDAGPLRGGAPPARAR